MKFKVAFAASFFVSAIVGRPDTANAFYRFVSSQFCVEKSAGQGEDYNASQWLAHYPPYGFTNWSPYQTVGLCPVIDDTSLPQQDIVRAIVYVYDGSSTAQMSAKACGQNPVGHGISCGSAVNNGAASVTGFASLDVTDLDPWDGSPWYAPYLHVDVPGDDDWPEGNGSGILAYYYFD